MRSALLLGSVAAAALAVPALALPDRYEQGYSCTGMDPLCMQSQLRQEDGNRMDEKAGGLNADRSTGATTAALSGGGDSDNELGDEIGDTADEAGDEISNAADEAGDAIGEAADDVGDAIGDAFD